MPTPATPVMAGCSEHALFRSATLSLSWPFAGPIVEPYAIRGVGLPT